MTGIQSSVGLISGIDYTSLVNQLIAIDGIPKDNLVARTTRLQSEQTALTDLMGRFLTSSYMINNLNKAAPYERCEVASSNTAVLTATKNGTPVAGSYTFTPLQTAMAQQTIAQGVVSDSEALGKTGTITIGKGWTLDNSVELKNLNGGAGVTKGSIRITDGSGTRATVDLRSAVTVQDVIDKINATDTIDVQAELIEDRIVLTDMSGGDPSKFLVQDVSGGSTASSLGLSGLTANENGIAVGNSIYRLGENMSLSLLNDGNGVVFDSVWADIVVDCKDGSQVQIDFFKRSTTAEIAEGTPEIHRELTIGDLLETINKSVDAAGTAGKVHARISDDGKGLVIEDTTDGTNFTKLTQLSTSPVFRTLGLIGGDYSGTPVNQYLDGVKAGKINVQDRSGHSASIELTQAEIDAFGSFDNVAAKLNEKLTAAGVGITVQINDTQNGLNVVDTTGGTGLMDFSDDVLTNPGSPGNLANRFGLDNAYMADADEVGGKVFASSYKTRNMIGDLDSVLMSTLNGGYGLSNAVAGSIEVQDRAGNKATLNFSQEELDFMQTFNDAVYLMNLKLETANVEVPAGADPKIGVGIRVQMNDTKTGFQLVDTTGQTSANMIFRDKVTTTETTTPGAEGEAPTVTTTTSTPKIASSLGLNVDAANSSVGGASMNRQTVSYSTKLSDMNGGKGVNLAGGKITITDSAGTSGTLVVNSKNMQTVGDVINAINSLNSNLKVVAKINETGDGIILEEFAGGPNGFTCLDSDSMSHFASDLKISGTISQGQKGADGRMRISGSSTHQVEVVATDTLEDIRKKINDLGGNFSATIITDGSNAPYRLSISGTATGAAGGMNIDLSALGLTTENMTEAQDALLAYGDVNTSAGLVLHSSSNTFKSVINGIDITVAGASTSPVTVTSASSNIDIKVSLQTFVDNYNLFREKLNEYTYYSVAENKGNILYANSTALAFDRDISNALLKRVYGIPGVTSLQDIGISIRKSTDDEDVNTSTGKLIFDEDKFTALWESNPDAIKQFFFKEQEILGDDGKPKTIKSGWAQSFTDVAESLTGVEGKVPARINTLKTRIDSNDERVAFMEARLEVKKQMMLNKFYAMEQAMAKMSSDMSTISGIASSWTSNYSSTGS
ncbi:hypothetical protein FACS1894189_2660 [Planctomycetales bacterium]|nr:hypothetical protein FACS1894189_2660 [Planctomycetales bacterium]